VIRGMLITIGALLTIAGTVFALQGSELPRTLRVARRAHVTVVLHAERGVMASPAPAQIWMIGGAAGAG
jgi:hypothetical protein